MYCGVRCVYVLPGVRGCVCAVLCVGVHAAARERREEGGGVARTEEREAGGGVGGWMR